MVFRNIPEGELENRLGKFKNVFVKGKTKPSATRVLDSWHRALDSIPNLTFGAYLSILPEVQLAIENSNIHGGDELTLDIKYSNRGIIVSVSDNGPGFNVSETIQKFFEGSKYYHVGGVGFIFFQESPAVVYFNEDGNKTYLGYSVSINEKRNLIKQAKSYREFSRGLFRRVQEYKNIPQYGGSLFPV